MNTHVILMVWHNAQDHFLKKITNPVYAYLNTLDHILEGYRGDSLLLAAEYNDCVTTIADAISTFDKLGFVFHLSKSVLLPTQEINYRIYNEMKKMKLRLTEKRKIALTECWWPFPAIATTK